jgi:hypothetical protein
MKDERRGQEMVDGASIPPPSRVAPPPPTRLPQPEPDLPDSQQYWDLMNRYNHLYGGLRLMLLQQRRIDPDVVLSEDALMAEVSTVFREAEKVPATIAVAREADMAERERWQRQETRWRALEMMSKRLNPGQGVDALIVGAKRLAEAIEADDFG